MQIKNACTHLSKHRNHSIALYLSNVNYFVRFVTIILSGFPLEMIT